MFVCAFTFYCTPKQGTDKDYTVLVRSTQRVVYKPYKLALQVSKSCPCCILEEAKRKTIPQKIGQLDGNCLTPYSPFLDVSADLAGPFRIKYRERKTGILIYLYNVTKALHLQIF